MQVASFYEQHGVPLLKLTDQSIHDLDKCLQHIQGCPGVWTVLIWGAFGSAAHRLSGADSIGSGGRLDQEMANINTLFR